MCCVQLALKMFHDVGLLQTFRVPIQKFIGFFHATEITYGSNPCTLPDTTVIRRSVPFHSFSRAIDPSHSRAASEADTNPQGISSLARCCGQLSVR